MPTKKSTWLRSEKVLLTELRPTWVREMLAYLRVDENCVYCTLSQSILKAKFSCKFRWFDYPDSVRDVVRIFKMSLSVPVLSAKMMTSSLMPAEPGCPPSKSHQVMFGSFWPKFPTAGHFHGSIKSCHGDVILFDRPESWTYLRGGRIPWKLAILTKQDIARFCINYIIEYALQIMEES